MSAWFSRAILRLFGSPSMLRNTVENRDVDKLRRLLDFKTELVNSLDGEGNSLLHIAAGKGSQGTDVEEILISYGADVDARNRLGSTPLHVVSRNGRLDLAALLLSSGAEVNATDRSWTPLHFAAYNGRVAICSLLLSQGAFVNCFDQCWRTPLHLAIDNRHGDVVQLLVEKGADVNWACEDGRFIGRHLTPLFLSVRSQQEDIARFLIAKGADVNTASRNGVTPLHEAAGRGLIRTVELLIEHGADLNALTKHTLYEAGGLRSQECGGATPVKLAMLADRTEAVQILRRHGGSES